MKERPILFSGPMVKAILEGRKTQTRRIMNPQPLPRFTTDIDYWVSGMHSGELGEKPNSTPYGVSGDRLWVRECIYIDTIPTGPLPKTRPADLGDDDIYYRADGECCDQIPECCCAEIGKPKWRPSIHMPRWASRITLEITDVRVQRVQEISLVDVAAEGAPKTNEAGWDSTDTFRELWETVNGPGAWERNDWVWALTFKRIAT